jgi:hypothetical protein
MSFYIQVHENQPVNHPTVGDQLCGAFGKIPSNWKPFTWVDQPSNTTMPVDVYQVAEAIYAPDGDGFKHQWFVRDMSEEERIKKIADIRSFFHFPSWSFDEPTCSWLPPIPKPDSDKPWAWDEETLNWKDMTPPQIPLSAVSFV